MAQPVVHPDRDRLVAIAARLRRLSPNYQNPERFWLDRDDLIDAVLRLAGER